MYWPILVEMCSRICHQCRYAARMFLSWVELSHQSAILKNFCGRKPGEGKHSEHLGIRADVSLCPKSEPWRERNRERERRCFAPKSVNKNDQYHVWQWGIYSEIQLKVDQPLD